MIWGYHIIQVQVGWIGFQGNALFTKKKLLHNFKVKPNKTNQKKWDIYIAILYKSGFPKSSPSCVATIERGGSLQIFYSASHWIQSISIVKVSTFLFVVNRRINPRSCPPPSTIGI